MALFAMPFNDFNNCLEITSRSELVACKAGSREGKGNELVIPTATV